MKTAADNGYDHFGTYHPMVTFLYFTAAMVFAMISFNPLCLGAALAGAAVYYSVVSGFRALLKRVFVIIPVFVITALINPTFNHRGVTILCYFPNGNPLTAESILFGLAAGEMLVTVMMWFDCFNKIITTDKIVYIFGRLLPGGSLLISMTLRFVPRLTQRFGEIMQTQKSMAKTQKLVFPKITVFVRSVSMLISWMLESSIQTSDSMQARGYGSGKRTDHCIFSFTARDAAAAAVMLLLGGLSAFCFARGIFAFDYYPFITGAKFSAPAYICFLMFYLVPAAINIKEEIIWRLLRSKI